MVFMKTKPERLQGFKQYVHDVGQQWSNTFHQLFDVQWRINVVYLF